MIDPITISLVSAAAGVLGAGAGVKSVSQAHKHKKQQQQQQQQNGNHLQLPLAQPDAPPSPQLIGVPNGGYVLYPTNSTVSSFPQLSPSSSSIYSQSTTTLSSPVGPYQQTVLYNSHPIPQCCPPVQPMYSSRSNASLISQEGHYQHQFKPAPPQYLDLYPMSSSSLELPDKKHHVRRWKN